MGYLSRRIKSFFQPAGSIADQSAGFLSLFGATTGGSGPLSPAQALRSPTTLACVRAIAETLAELPIHLFERTATGKQRVTAADHAAAAILARDANGWTSISELRTAILTDALLHGAGFALIARAGDRVAELHRLPPAAVTVDETGPGGEPVFKVSRADGGTNEYDWRDVLWVRTPGSAPGRPIKLIQELREAIWLDLELQAHLNRILQRGARPSGILNTGALTLQPAEKERLRKQFDELYSGAGNSGKTLSISGDMKFDALQFSLVDLQYLETKRLAVEEIARGFKVPPTVIGVLDRATHKNVEELNRQFVQNCLLPWAAVEKAAFSRVLLTAAERETHFVEHQFGELLRGSTAERHAAYRQAAGGSWLTPNEVRALENLPPIEGGEALIAQAGQAEMGASDKEPANAAA